MTPLDDRDCNTCRHFDPMDGKCGMDGEEHDPCQEPCERWADWEDTDER